ncbi:hypothetical protein EDD16DRAFT_1481048 [Pisolithus croceorrhizus]|nr:hypothetical protein EV401DRAFT_1865420 [Pisolithus croceorrhizus]KAI6117825.1 hypothetical protein EDD16DRAFT_1481048 [Pisolithus croceorrhizus]KAI6163337.1 hypothetical protein EDD17DRAFT_1476707 [Pisolithus thermaeus]
MNLAETNFSVDRCTPRDKYARTCSFMPRSIPGIDDLVLDSPLNAFCVMGDEFRPHLRSRPSPLEGIWRNAGSSVPTDETFVMPEYQHHGDAGQNPVDPTDNISLPRSPKFPSFVALDSALRDAGFDASCLDALDEQLLRSPTDCFSDICWAAAVQDEQIRCHQREVVELDVDVVDMGVNVGAVGEKQMNELEKSSENGGWDVYVPPSPPLSPQRSKPVKRDRPDVLAASEARILYSNPNESVHYFPVPRDREKKGRREPTTSASRDASRKKCHPQSQTHTQTQFPASSPSHSPSSSRSRSQGPGGKKSRKQRFEISDPVPLPPHVASAIAGATNTNTSATHVHTIPIPIPTFPASGYYAFPPSTPPLPPPPLGMLDVVDHPHVPCTPKSPGRTLRKISSAYSTLTGRKRVKSTV